MLRIKNIGKLSVNAFLCLNLIESVPDSLEHSHLRPPVVTGEIVH